MRGGNGGFLCRSASSGDFNLDTCILNHYLRQLFIREGADNGCGEVVGSWGFLC